MRAIVFLFSVLMLCACTSGEEDVAARQQAEQGWKELAMERMVRNEEKALSDKQAPAHHRQLARAFARMVSDCVMDRRGERTWKIHEDMAMDFIKEETRCAHRLIRQTLVQGGADRAYEASLAAKSVDPEWFEPVLPSYVSVD